MTAAEASAAGTTAAAAASVVPEGPARGPGAVVSAAEAVARAHEAVVPAPATPESDAPRAAAPKAEPVSKPAEPEPVSKPAVPGAAVPAPDSAVADRVWDAMRDLVHDYERRREVSEALGMSIAKIKALRRLAARPMTGKELAVELMTDAPRASVLIDELVQRGLAVRTVHPEDRRVRIVGVTDLGAAEADRATKILCRAPDSLRSLPSADLAELDRILRRFAAPRA